MKIIIRNAVLIFFLIIYCTLFAQETKIDSLQHQLSSLEGYERYDVLMQLTKQSLCQQPDIAFKFAKVASGVALEEGKIEESMTAEEYLGITNIIMGNHDFYKYDETQNLRINTKDNSGNWNSAGFEDDFVTGRGYNVGYENIENKTYSGELNVGDFTFNGTTTPAITSPMEKARAGT